MSPRSKLAAALTALAGLAAVATTVLFLGGTAWAATAAVPTDVTPAVLQWGFLAAALATGLSSLGAGYAVAVVGSAAVGALAEKPELLGRVLILVGLAEGIAIYGLIISVLILTRLG